MTDPRITAFQSNVESVLVHLHGEFAKLQTGRASPVLVDRLPVEAYGQRQELRSVAGVSVQDAKTIAIQPWDRSILGNIERALQAANLGASVLNDGALIRVVLPPMTEERRKELIKVVHRLSEEARISVRKARQECHDAIKSNEKDEDRKFTLLEELEKAVKTANEKIEESRRKKEEEIMKV